MGSVQEEQLLSSLSEYNARKGKCAFVEAQIEDLERMIREAYATLISGQVLASAEQDGMPRGNQVSRTVENLAVRLADGWLPNDLRDMNEELSRLYRQRDILKSQVARVEAWLKGLNDRQRFVIERQVIQGESWKDVTIQYRKMFGDSASKRTTQRIRDTAIEVMLRMSGQ